MKQSQSNTDHLFYDKYVNKVVIELNIATLFRDRDLSRVKNSLAVYDKLLEDSGGSDVWVGQCLRKRRVTVPDVLYASKLLALLQNNDNFSVRVERHRLAVYSNNDALIKAIVKIDAGLCVKEVSEPASDKVKDYLLSNPHTIIVKSYTHKYKVTVCALYADTANFHSWAEKLSGKIKLLSRTYQPGSGGYFYVADDRVLGMCKLFLGSKIRRVDTLVTESEI